jgi:hypothetical protein
MNQQLKPETEFSRRLRAELTAIVAERGAAQVGRAIPGDPATVPVWRRRGTSFGLVLGAAAVLAIAGVMLIVGAGSSDTPAAFAVEVKPEGLVSVEINSLEDAKGLENALEEAGIPASISYLGSGMVCKEPRFQSVPWPEGARTFITGPGNGGGPIHFLVGSETVGPGQTLVFTASPGSEATVDHIEAKLADGPVAACEPVPATSQ